MIEIHQHILYRAEELKTLLGARCLAALRREGALRAVGDWYLGQTVLDSFARVATMKASGASPAREEAKIEKERAKKSVAKAADRKTVQPVSGRKGDDSLRGQLEALQRELRAATVQR
jgi:hypothetical protein